MVVVVVDGGGDDDGDLHDGVGGLEVFDWNRWFRNPKK